MPFAVFFDMLGTSQAMTSLPDDHEFEKDDWSKLSFARSRFRAGLKWGAERAKDSLVLCASFSDCGYFVIKSPVQVLRAVRRAMNHFQGNVPVRGGIGFGNFGVDGTTHQWNGSSAFTEASFFGSALVRAHRAESCGHKGFRILVHESAVEGLKAEHVGISVYPEDTAVRDEEDPAPPDVPGTVVEIPFSPYPDVAHEVCWIGHDHITDWFRSIDWLEKTFHPDASSRDHYSESRAALERFQRMRLTG